MGPQTRFPVPQGILDYSGQKYVVLAFFCVANLDIELSSLPTHSTVAVALWALDDTAVSPQLKLEVDAVLEGGVGPIALNNPGWTALRG